MATFQDKIRTTNASGLIVATPAGATGGTAIDAIAIVPTANAAAADLLTITNASYGQATTLTIPDPGASTGLFALDSVATTYVKEKVSTITAGTTQTQAGATPITSGIAYVTTGNVGDGVILPALSASMIGTQITLINASAHNGTVYCPGTTSTNTINGTAGATGVTYAASKTLFLVAVSATAWVSTLSN